MKHTILLLPILFSVCVLAQTPSIDKLKKQYSLTTTVDEKQAVLEKMFTYHQSLNKDSLLKYIAEAKKISSKKYDKRFNQVVAFAEMDVLIRLGKTDSALKIINKLLPENPISQIDTRKNYFLLEAKKIDCFGDNSNYTEALNRLYRLVNQAEKYNDSVALARNMSTIGVIQYNLNHLPEAFRWYFKGLSYTNTQRKFDESRTILYINLAETYWWISKFDSAEYFVEKAFLLCNISENLFHKSNALRVRSEIYQYQDKADAAEKDLAQCVQLSRLLNGDVNRSNEKLSFAILLRSHKKFEQAIALLEDGLKDKSSDIDILKISYLTTLSKTYKLANQQEKYAATLERLNSAKDSFYLINSAKSIAELQEKYEVQKKEATIVEQKYELLQKNYWLFGSIVAAVFLLILGWVLFQNFRRKKELEILKLQEEEKLAIAHAKEIERNRIAADLHDNLGVYAASIAANVQQIQQQKNEAVALNELNNNSQAMIAQLSDTIWVMKKEQLSITSLGDRIKTFIQKLQPSYSDILIDVIEEIKVEKSFSAAEAFQLLKILQEAITNALKHSRCNAIKIILASSTDWKIEVIDNGVGMAENNISGNGLLQMQQRADEVKMLLNIENKSPNGTVVSIQSVTTNRVL